MSFAGTVIGAPELPSEPPTNSDNRARGREKKQRIEFVGKMLSMGWSGKEIEAIAGTRYGVSGRAVRTYIKLARRQFVDSLEMTANEMNAYLFHLLLEVVKHPATNGNAKVKAVGEMAKLTGAYKPTKSITAHIDGHSMVDLLDLVEGDRRAPVIGDMDVRNAVANAIAESPEQTTIVESVEAETIIEKPAEQIAVDDDELDPFAAAIAEANKTS